MNRRWEEWVPWLLTLPLGAVSLWIAMSLPRWEAQERLPVEHPAVFFLPLFALGLLVLLADQARRGEDDTSDDQASAAWRLITAGCFLFLLGAAVFSLPLLFHARATA